MLPHSLLSARRVLRKDVEQLDRFLGYATRLRDNGNVLDTPADGPMNGDMRVIDDLQLRGALMKRTSNSSGGRKEDQKSICSTDHRKLSNMR